MAYKHLLYEEKDGIGILTLNRPDKLNAFNTQLFQEFYEVLTEIQKNPQIKAVIITGAGQKAFCAGADVDEFLEMNPILASDYCLERLKILALVENFTKPIIAAINGFALGGGCELAMSCHIRIASERAKLGQPEVKLGIMPGWGGTQRLPRLVGKGIALELLLTGKHIDAHEAYRIGLVNKVVKPEELMDAAMNLAKEITNNSPVAVQFILKAVNEGTETGLTYGLELESKLFGLCFTTQDMREGIKAFLERRKPKFTGK
jgi:enoyl-CoA hydratase